jgi:hypothetical protein
LLRAPETLRTTPAGVQDGWKTLLRKCLSFSRSLLKLREEVGSILVSPESLRLIAASFMIRLKSLVMILDRLMMSPASLMMIPESVPGTLRKRPRKPRSDRAGWRSVPGT